AALALRCMDGVFLSPSEDEFVGRITEELEHFMLQGQHYRVLLFPPLSSRLRYLIHRTVENVDLLSSFSVGEGWRRRTVICHSAVRLPSETKPSEAKPSSNPSSLHRPAQPWGRGGRGGRPRAVSLPEEQAEDSPSAGTEPQGGSSKLQSQGREGPGDVRLEPEQNPPEAPHEPQAVPEPDPPAAEEQKEAWVDAPGQNPGGQNPGGQVPVAEEEGKEGPGLWDELHLSAGDEESRGGPGQSSPEDDCTAELLAEIVNYLSVKDISIEKISFDYSTYGEAQLTQGDFGHVTEIYDFSPAMKTEQLLEVFSDFHESGFKIQWVDDTHALGIFSSLSTASQALGRRYPALKIRPLLHATKQSKTKALQRPKLLHLAKERPQTDTVVAKRLVSRALGLKNKHQAEGGSGPEGLLPESLEQEE
ncbi:R3H and coiled-coil domain-containing protein 1, partial [Dryobates pubescens]